MNRAIRDKAATRAQQQCDRVGYAKVATDPERERFQRAARARRRG